MMDTVYEGALAKINLTLDGLVIFREGEKVQVSPIIYLDTLYAYYMERGSLEETLWKATSIMLEAMEISIDVHDMQNVRENIVFQVINTMQNQRLLANLPNRPFHDLSIIYRYIVGKDDNNTFSTVINNSIAEHMGLGEVDLFRLAEKNTRRILPPSIKPMSDLFTGIPLGQIMWVISNETGINGAASILYEDELYKLAESLKSDLYIIPSSIHECIAVSADIGNPEELACMVAEINENQVDIEERLSNLVYHYDKNSGVLTIAAGTSNTFLQYADE